MPFTGADSQLVDWFLKLAQYASVDRLGLLLTAVIPFTMDIEGNQQIAQTTLPNDYFASFIVVVLVVGVFLVRWKGPQISLNFAQVGHNNMLELQDSDEIDGNYTPNGDNIEVKMQFDVPSHYDEIYVSFEAEGYQVSVSQTDPVNFDTEKAVTYHSSIDAFDLMLLLVPEGDTNNGSKVPLVVKDKLNNRVIKEIKIVC